MNSFTLQTLGIITTHLKWSTDRWLLVQVLAGWNIGLCLFPFLRFWSSSLCWLAHTHPVLTKLNNAKKNFSLPVQGETILVQCHLFRPNSTLTKRWKILLMSDCLIYLRRPAAFSLAGKHIFQHTYFMCAYNVKRQKDPVHTTELEMRQQNIYKGDNSPLIIDSAAAKSRL